MKKFLVIVSMLVMSAVSFAWGGSGSGGNNGGTGSIGGGNGGYNNYQERSTSAKSAHSMWRRGDVVFMNVSSRNDQSRYGIVSGSITSHYYTSASSFRNKIQNLDRYRTYVIYDSGSGSRGRSAAKVMADNGFSNVYYMSGGLSSWKRYGYPTIYP